MKFLSGIRKGRGEGEDDDLEDTDEAEDPAVNGLFGKLVRKLKPSRSDIDDMDDTEYNTLDSVTESLVQQEQLDDLPDPHAAGESGEALVPPRGQAESDGGNGPPPGRLRSLRSVKDRRPPP